MVISPSPKRRTFIALGGSFLLAGCLFTNDDTADQQTPTSPSLDSSRLQEAASREVPDTGPTYPVTIEESYLERGRERTRDLLVQYEDRVDEVDAGDEKDEMREMASRAETALQDSQAADTDSRALREIRAARADATEALWTAKAALNEVNRNDALEARSPVRDQLQDLRNRNWYIGPDIDATIVAAYKVEDWTMACEEALSEAETQEAFLDAYRVGKTAERVETARAFLDNASYFVEQLQAQKTTTDYASSFKDAVETIVPSLTETVNDERIGEKYPTEPEEMFDHEISTASAELVSRAAGGTAYHTNWMKRYEQQDGLAGALLYAIAGRRDLSVFEDVRAAVEEDGDAYPRLEAADRVDDAMRDIVETVADARQNPTHEFIESFLIRRLAIEISVADRRMKSVLEDNSDDARIYDAALELWGDPTLAGKRLDETQTAITTVFNEIGESSS